MEKESLPPSYDEVVNPSAPPTQGNQPVRQPMNPGWNTQPSHIPQYPVMAQPMIYQQPQQIPQQIIIINQQLQLTEFPTCIMCPQCKQQMVTKVEYVTSGSTHVIAMVLCLLGLCPCAIIPYCTDAFKDAAHTCSKCNAYIGIHTRSHGRRRNW